nr:hypothetical protein [Sphingobium sp. CFD-2]
MDDFYAARSSTSPPPPWSNFAPPFSDRLRQTTYYDRHIPENAYVEIASLDGMVTIFAGHTLQILFLIVDFPVSVHMHEIIGKEIVEGSQIR